MLTNNEHTFPRTNIKCLTKYKGLNIELNQFLNLFESLKLKTNKSYVGIVKNVY